MLGGCLSLIYRTKDALTFVHSTQNLASAFKRDGDHARSSTRLYSPVKALLHAACGHPLSFASHPEPRPKRPDEKQSPTPTAPTSDLRIREKRHRAGGKAHGRAPKMEPKQTSARADKLLYSRSERPKVARVISIRSTTARSRGK
ncbi:uncharacterized [Tachysurus ichikawai]